jgi:hypothetical protein
MYKPGHLNEKNKIKIQTVALPFTLKKYLKAKEELQKNSNISPCKNIIFKKSS